MLKTYRVRHRFFYNGKCQWAQNHYSLLDESDVQNMLLEGVDFENLWKLGMEFSGLMPFTCWEYPNKPKYIEMYSASFWSKKVTPNNVKSWKYTRTYEPCTVSMEQLMKFDSGKVIQYLKEQGINAIPVKNI